MRRATVGAAAVLLLVATVAMTVLLAREGLDRAEKMISIGGVLATLALSVLAWRSGRGDDGGPVIASGVGAAAVGGSNHGPITTRVVLHGPPPPGPAAPAGPGVQAGGAGSVAVGGDSTAGVRTDVQQQ
jgi:hypothetical protein